MTAAAEELKERLIGLSVQEQAELAHFLIHRLDEEGYDDDYDAAWAAELDRRRERVISGQDSGEDADVTLARIRAKLS